MTEPHVSVVIPTHRRPALLRRTLESLIGQTYPSDRFDVHVVQNVEDSETAAVVADIAAAAPMPVRHSLKPANGPAPSRHHGAATAKGDIIAFIDDDCRAHPEWLRAGVAGFADPAVGLIQGQTLPDPDQPRHYLEKTVLVDGPTPFFETCNIFYRKTAFDMAGGFTGPFAKRFYGEDTDLGWRTRQAGWTTGFAPDALVHHEVFRQPVINWLMEAWHLRNLPLLVKHWPQMRRTMFLGWFLHRQSAGFDLLLLGVVLWPFAGPWSALLGLPYLWVRSVERGRYSNPLKIVARIVLGLPRACVTFVALATGSLRHRSFLL